MVNWNPQHWIDVARSIWSPELMEDAPRAFEHLVPTTSVEGEAIESFFADPSVLRSVDPLSQTWSNVGEAFGWLVRSEITVERLATSADLYFCCGVVGLFLVVGKRPFGHSNLFLCPNLVDEDAVAHAMIGAAYNLKQRDDDHCRPFLQKALSEWPMAFCEARRNELPGVLASVLVAASSRSEDASEALAEKLGLILDAFDYQLPAARAMVVALVLAK